VLLDNEVWPEYVRRDLADIAAERGQDGPDAIFDLLEAAADDTRRLMVIIRCYSEHQQRTAFAHPLCVPGSDATTLAPDGPLGATFFHGAYSWASWFYRFMVREHGILSPEAAIHKLTRQPAERLGFADRGILREGAAADIAVFDPERFADSASTFEPNRLALGMVHVVVNGVPTLVDGELTGRRAGAVLRRTGNEN
jgi:N-acyl-D-amino-acid deacylase